MRASRANPSLSESTDQSGSESRAVSIADLAHELNSLLDGSIRSLVLAERSLESSEPAAAPVLIGVQDRLRLAKEGLRSMAELLERALQAPEPSLSLFAQNQNLAELLAHIDGSLTPMASELDVEVTIEWDEPSAKLPARSLGPVILNGLRNAIRAAGRSSQRRVKLSIQASPVGDLAVSIEDSGAGIDEQFEFGKSTEADGHGVGLDLSRRIVSDLGGQIDLSNRSSGNGAVLRITVPLDRLVQA